jgi:hypothetical protein
MYTSSTRSIDGRHNIRLTYAFQSMELDWIFGSCPPILGSPLDDAAFGPLVHWTHCPYLEVF